LITTVELHAGRCALCDTEGNATEIYPANFKADAFSPAIFSARRLPDRVHYRIVKCKTCGLVRSDPVADPTVVADLYRRSTFDYADEVDNLRRTYGYYLKKLDKFTGGRGAILEIGCGSGFFLEQARAQGYAEVRGVEPSSEAVARAELSVRHSIECDVLRPGLFEPESFQVICMFQVFEHLLHPASALGECWRLLKNGGLLLILNHNIEAISTRLLGERSPIIDLEHAYLYSPGTLARLLQERGFLVRRSGVAWNVYSLRYLARLLPLPRRFKQTLLSALQAMGIGRIRLAVPLGNFYMVAQKPG
jgi:SAM-dependent methyltransferase